MPSILHLWQKSRGNLTIMNSICDAENLISHYYMVYLHTKI